MWKVILSLISAATGENTHIDMSHDLIHHSDINNDSYDYSYSHSVSHNFDLDRLSQPRSSNPSYSSNIDDVGTPNWNHSPSGYHVGDKILISQHGSDYSLKIEASKWDMSISDWIYHVKSDNSNSDNGNFDDWIPQSKIKGYA